MMSQFKYLFYLLKNGKFKNIYNHLWTYSLWVSKYWQEFFLIKLFPKLGIELYPPFVEIEVTTACNLRCKICEHTYWNEKSRNMTFDEFKMIADQFPNLKWAGLAGIGSSFLNKDFSKMLRHLKKTSNPTIELIDTFYNINETMASEIIDLQVDFFLISLWAATKDTYEKLMVGSDFDRSLNNIKTFIRLKKEKKSLLPAVSFHYVISKENAHEMELYLDLIHSLDADEFMIEYTPVLHGFKEVEDMSVDISDETIKKINEKAKKMGKFVYYNLSFKKKKPPISKCARWIMPFIFATGHVVPCCVGNEANKREFQKEYALGNVFEQSFKDIWYGEKYTEFRKLIRQGKVPIQCKTCTVFETKTV